MKFNISTDDVDRAVEEEFNDIDNALDETAKQLRKEGLEAAKNHIRAHDKIWTRELLNNWVPTQTESIVGGVKMYGWENYSADHADVVDKGATYDKKKPPMQELLPWVSANMVPKPGQSYEDLAYLVQEIIYREGIEGINFKRVATGVMNARANSVLKEKMARK